MPKKQGSELPKGWYEYKSGSQIERFWDGQKWTESIRVNEKLSSNNSDSTLRFKTLFRNRKELFLFTTSSVVVALLAIATFASSSFGLFGKVPSESSSAKSSSSQPIEDAPAGFKESISGNPEECKVPDSRSVQLEPRNVGFPHSIDFLPISGELNFIIVPIDFSDAVGEGSPQRYVDEQTDQMKKWMSFFSSGKVTYNFQTTSNWIRAAKPSASYAIEKGSPNAMNVTQELQNQMAQDLIDATGNTFDFSSVNGVIFVFPNSILGLENDLSGNGTTFNTPQGSKQLYVRGAGRHAYQDWGGRLSTEVKNGRMWEYWTHEILHAQGFALHAPGNGFNAGIGQNPWSETATLDAWELFKAGWLTDAQVFCDTSSSHGEKYISITPLEVEGNGNKTAIVRISETEAIVIESHRPMGFSSEVAKYSSRMDYEGGVLVYRIDTKLDNDRTGENSGDNGNDPAWTKWAYFLSPDGVKSSDAVNNPDGIVDFVMTPGQKITYGGTTISMLKSGNKDYISISK